jgi:hypothetical protein
MSAVIVMQACKIGNLAIEVPRDVGTHFTVPVLNLEVAHSPGDLCASLSNIGCDMLMRVVSDNVFTQVIDDKMIPVEANIVE